MGRVRTNRHVIINKKVIGEGESAYVVAEAGFNHKGSLSMAIKMIKAAKRAGANAIKFQTFYADEIVKVNSEHYKLLENADFSIVDYRILRNTARKEKIDFISTPYGYGSTGILEKLDPDAYKIASMDLTNLPFLGYIASKGKPLIISTGMSEIKEIKEAVNVIKKAGNPNIIILHCISCYPLLAKDANLRYITYLDKLFNAPIGFSDHALGINVALAAVCLGGCVIEKHFTLDKRFSGPDHRLSCNPKELRSLTKSIREIVSTKKGSLNFRKRPDFKFRKLYRRSVFAATDILKDTEITEDMIKFIRPGFGISPKSVSMIIGRKAKKYIPKDSMLKIKEIE